MNKEDTQLTGLKKGYSNLVGRLDYLELHIEEFLEAGNNLVVKYRSNPEKKKEIVTMIKKIEELQKKVCKL